MRICLAIFGLAASLWGQDVFKVGHYDWIPSQSPTDLAYTLGTLGENLYVQSLSDAQISEIFKIHPDFSAEKVGQKPVGSFINYTSIPFMDKSYGTTGGNLVEISENDSPIRLIPLQLTSLKILGATATHLWLLSVDKIYKWDGISTEQVLTTPYTPNNIVLFENTMYFLLGTDLWQLDLISSTASIIVTNVFYRFFIEDNEIIYLDQDRVLFAWNMDTQSQRNIKQLEPNSTLLAQNSDFIFYKSDDYIGRSDGSESGTFLVGEVLNEYSSNNYRIDVLTTGLIFQNNSGYFFINGQLGQIERLITTPGSGAKPTMSC